LWAPLADAFHGAVQPRSEQVKTPQVFWQVTVCQTVPEEEGTMRLRNAGNHHTRIQRHIRADLNFSNTTVRTSELTKSFLFAETFMGAKVDAQDNSESDFVKAIIK
jgi:hypothetical protein